MLDKGRPSEATFYLYCEFVISFVFIFFFQINYFTLLN